MFLVLILPLLASPGRLLAVTFHVAILPTELFQHGYEKLITAESINRQQVDFAIFCGDSKDGRSPCDDATIGGGLQGYFQRLHVPTLYSLGDNEWTDCHRISNGGYDPLERLAFLRQTFFNNRFTQGPDPIPVERQGRPGEPYSENSRFLHKDVLFVSLHLVGSNNNLVATARQCRRHSNRSRKDCELATKEYCARNKQNIKWLRDSFRHAKMARLPAVVLVWQADIFSRFDPGDRDSWPNFLSTLDESNGFATFYQALVREIQSYPGHVLIIHGDTHLFTVNRSMFDLQGNPLAGFTRIVTFGGNDTSWIDLRVDTESLTPFHCSPVFLPPVQELRPE